MLWVRTQPWTRTEPWWTSTPTPPAVTPWWRTLYIRLDPRTTTIDAN